MHGKVNNKIQKVEQNFNPGLALVGLSGTRTRRALKNTSNKFHQKALNCKQNRQIEIAMIVFQRGSRLVSTQYTITMQA